MAKVSAVIITDTHLKEENAKQVISIFDQARRLAKKLKLKTVEHGGDIYNSRKGQVIPNLKAFLQILDDFKKDGLKLRAIPGNHDKTAYKSQHSFLDPFSHHPAFQLFDKPDFVTLNGGDIVMDVLPFFSDAEYLQHLELYHISADSIKPHIALTHIGLDGAKMNNGTVIKSKVTAKDFSCYEKVLVGHYHDPAVYGNIEYIGAALQHNFGEKPIKGATVLYDDLSTELVELVFPKYLAYEISADDVTLKDIEDLKEAAESNGDNLRVVLTGSEASIKAVDKQRLQLAGVSVTTKQDKINMEDIEESVEQFTDQSILDAFKVFCSKNNLPQEEGLKYLNNISC